MISDHNLGALMGAPVTGPGDEKIGTVGQVFVDPDTGKPNWVTVHTGLFGRHESFVPVDDATWDREILHVPYSKDVVKDAPRIDTDQALSPEDERSLYRYYGMPTDDVDEGDVVDVDRGNVDDDRGNVGGGNTEPSPGVPVSAPVATAAPAPGAPQRHEQLADDRPIAEQLAEATRRFVERQKSGSGTSETDTANTHTSDTATSDTETVRAGTSDTRPSSAAETVADTRDDAGAHESTEQSSGRMRMRKYVIVEEQVPIDSDEGLGNDLGTPRQS